MLEHADGNDPVERSIQRAVVDQLKAAAFGETRLLGARSGQGDLFLRERDAQHSCAAVSREIERKPAPSRTDIEHAQVRAIEKQLGGDVTLLADLRLVQCLAGRRKICTGVLAVAVEKNVVEPAGKIVMVSNIFSGTRGIVALCKRPGDPPPGLCQPQHTGWARQRKIVHQKIEQIGNIAVLYGYPAIHVELAELQLGIGRKLPGPTTIMKSNAEFRLTRTNPCGALAGHGQRQCTRLYD